MKKDIWVEIEDFGQGWAFEGKQMWKRDHLVEICKETLGKYGAFKGNGCGRGGPLSNNRGFKTKLGSQIWKKGCVQKGFLGRNTGSELKWGF